MTESQLELLRDKYVLWDRASRTGAMVLRDYNRRCAEALKEALCIVAASPRSLGVSQDEPPPPAEPPVEGWMGIESAPTDGTEIWAFIPPQRQAVMWFDDNADGECFWQDEGDSQWEPTHWMPLPSPPLSAKDTSERNGLARDDDKAKPSTSLGGDSRASVASSSLPDGRSEAHSHSGRED